MPLKKSESISLNDRFFLGGPLGLRGFTNRGVGPNKEGKYTIHFFFLFELINYLKSTFLKIAL